MAVHNTDSCVTCADFKEGKQLFPSTEKKRKKKEQTNGQKFKSFVKDFYRGETDGEISGRAVVTRRQDRRGSEGQLKRNFFT